MKYLVKTTEQYRVDTESEVKQFIEEAKKDKKYNLNKYTSEYKTVKAKGEVIDDFYRVTLVKEFTVEKEPDRTVTVSYNIEDGAFPEPLEKVEEDFE